MTKLVAFDDRLDEATHQAIEAFGLTAQDLISEGKGRLVDAINDVILQEIFGAGIDVDTLPEQRLREKRDSPDAPLDEAIERVLALYNLDRTDVDIEELSQLFVLLQGGRQKPAIEPGL